MRFTRCNTRPWSHALTLLIWLSTTEVVNFRNEILLKWLVSTFATISILRWWTNRAYVAEKRVTQNYVQFQVAHLGDWSTSCLRTRLFRYCHIQCISWVITQVKHICKSVSMPEEPITLVSQLNIFRFHVDVVATFCFSDDQRTAAQPNIHTCLPVSFRFSQLSVNFATLYLHTACSPGYRANANP